MNSEEATEEFDRLYRRAGLLAESGDFGGALAIYQSLLTRVRGLASLWFNTGTCLVRLGRFREGAMTLAKGLEIEERASAWCELAVSLWSDGLRDDAMFAIDRSLQLDPDYIEAWANKALFLREVWRHDEALECYDHALTILPAEVKVLAGKAKLLIEMHRYEDAVATVSRILEIDPSYEPAIELKTWCDQQVKWCWDPVTNRWARAALPLPVCVVRRDDPPAVRHGLTSWWTQNLLNYRSVWAELEMNVGSKQGPSAYVRYACRGCGSRSLHDLIQGGAFATCPKCGASVDLRPESLDEET